MIEFARKMTLEFAAFPHKGDHDEFVEKVSVQPKLYHELLSSDDYWVKSLGADVKKRIYANERFYFYNLYPVRRLTECQEKWEFAGRAELVGCKDLVHSLVYTFNIVNDSFPLKWFNYISKQFPKLLVRMNTCIVEKGAVTHVSTYVNRFGEVTIA